MRPASDDDHASASPADESAAADKLRILIVEDDLVQREALQQFFQRCGYRVAAAPDYDTALAAAQRLAPQVAICDWMILGRRTGVDVARALSARHELSIIFMTGASLTDLKRESSDLPVVRYFRKPVMPDALARTVQSLQ